MEDDAAVRAGAYAVEWVQNLVGHSLHPGGGASRRNFNGALKLHEGGESYVTLPKMDFTKAQISPTRDTRLRWMQSLLHCTHYIAGAGEQAYLRKEDAPEITFVNRDAIDRSDEAYH